jgi:hypothetical protein
VRRRGGFSIPKSWWQTNGEAALFILEQFTWNREVGLTKFELKLGTAG